MGVVYHWWLLAFNQSAFDNARQDKRASFHEMTNRMMDEICVVAIASRFTTVYCALMEIFASSENHFGKEMSSSTSKRTHGIHTSPCYKNDLHFMDEWVSAMDSDHHGSKEDEQHIHD
ncbi:hypothetical protein KIN20_002281 [Parelaphostrongylus tenuis]|uniref:Uncharacterized protein n=1 Tax=Parelaphostrongylus tenuis TaxID=148309 RepID=A0AAD5QGM4_PARTN|nr:hypothetical protein KIN20_002281 [Parelaphostrongylus tenuis]